MGLEQIRPGQINDSFRINFDHNLSHVRAFIVGLEGAWELLVFIGRVYLRLSGTLGMEI